MIKHKKNDEIGITLIALVITIIVLLILAGISIQMLTGDNGILNRASHAKEEYEYAQNYEQNQLNTIEEKITEKMNEMAVKYTIQYNSNDATGTMSNTTIIEGQQVKLPPNAFQKVGYIFDKWISGEGEEYQNEQEIVANKNLILTAQWLPINSTNLKYISDNLVFHLDGIYNIKTEHTSNTNVWKDISGNGIDAALGNGCTITENGINMNKSTSAIITLNNSNIINALNNSSNGFTISMLVNMESNAEEYQTLFHCGEIPENNKVRCLIAYKDNKMCFGLYYNDLKEDFTDYFNKKTLIDCVYENGYKKMYINGNLATENVSEGFQNIESGSTFYIGDTVYRGNYYGRAIDGIIYSTKLYSKALSASQIKNNYDVDKARYGL